MTHLPYMYVHYHSAHLHSYHVLLLIILLISNAYFIRLSFLFLCTYIPTSMFSCQNRGDQMCLWKNPPNPFLSKLMQRLIRGIKVSQLGMLVPSLIKKPYTVYSGNLHQVAWVKKCPLHLPRAYNTYVHPISVTRLGKWVIFFWGGAAFLKVTEDHNFWGC
jgi:hypothetical protein